MRLTADLLGVESFACNTAYMSGQPVPSVRYDLKTDQNLTVDMAYSCYLWGQLATTQENGIWKKSERRISSQALREMKTPRIERYITKPQSLYITYMGIDAFQWDRVVLSHWLLPASDEKSGNAPSAYRRLTTAWAAQKKRDILQ